MLFEPIDETLVGVLELFRIIRRPHGHTRIVEHYRLYSFRTHYRANSTSACMPSRPKLHIGAGYRSDVHLHLSGRADRNAGYLVAELGLHFSHEIIIGEHLEAVID